jgi:predicted outer membrane repeat protein
MEGGGLCNLNGSPIIDSCTFNDNSAGGSGGGAGAGIATRGGNPLIVDSVFVDLYAGRGMGSALFISGGAPVVRGSRFESSFVFGGGGAVFVMSGTPSFENCLFEDNGADQDGGAIYVTASGAITVSFSEFRNNHAFAGGAIYSQSGEMNIVGSLFSENIANYRGGAVSGSAAIVDSVFFANTAAVNPLPPVYGGAVYGSGTIVNSTFVENEAESLGSSMPGRGGAVYGEFDIRNSIFYDNVAAQGPDVYGAGGPTVSHSIIRPPYTCDVPLTCLEADPDFVDIDGEDFTPQNPLCIDSADSTYLPLDALDIDGDGVTTEPIPLDFQGEDRVVGSGVDMGAVEVQYVQYVQ